MKKILSLVLCIVLAVSMFSACGNRKTREPAGDTNNEKDNANNENQEGAVMTGLAAVTSVAKSKEAGDEDGLAQVDSTIVAVLVDQEGRILDCKIDGAQTKINFSKEGKLLSDLTSEYKTKQELKEEYGMKKASGIGKEWYEQANTFADYVKGKTVDEVKGIAVDEEGKVTDADLVSSVTMNIGGILSALEKSVASARDLGATNTDKLGLAVSTNIDRSTEAEEDKEGVAQAYSFYTAVTTDGDGRITSCFIDSSQGVVTFNTEGAITTDISKEQLTKQELKEAYGMKKVSGIEKEWYEQADSFADYVMGKTIEEVKGIAVSEEGKATDEDLVSSVTITVSPLIAIVEKAVMNISQ